MDSLFVVAMSFELGLPLRLPVELAVFKSSLLETYGIYSLLSPIDDLEARVWRRRSAAIAL